MDQANSGDTGADRAAESSGDDLLMFGHRLRHFRKRAGMTLADLGDKVGRPAPYLSQLENGHTEPRLSLISELAAAVGTTSAELLSAEAPSRRAELEVKLLQAQEDPLYASLRLPYLKPSAKLPDEALEHLVTLYDMLCRGGVETEEQGAQRAGDRARQANNMLRMEMRQRDNYFANIETIASQALQAVGYGGTGPVSERTMMDLCSHFGFSVSRVQHMPRSARSITDQKNRVIYIPQRNDLPTRAARSVVLQTLGHFALGHTDSEDFSDYLQQRVESNYFSAAILAPEKPAVDFLRQAHTNRDISVEDLKEIFYISYEMAAHRLTNLATRHLELPVHFLRSDEEGVVWKAYENNGVPLPAHSDGSIEGMRLCQHWGTRQAFESEDSFSLHYQYTDTPDGAYWCVTHVEADRSPFHAVTVGATAKEAQYFRGSDTDRRTSSTCPDPACCRAPRPEQQRRWEGAVWPSARDRSHVVSGLPLDGGPGFSSYPGVDMAEVYSFLDQRQTQE